MRSVFFLIIYFLYSLNCWALEYSKIEFDGCSENAFCKKETGITRKKWIEQLNFFLAGKMTAQKFNIFLQSEYGLPVSGWAQESGSLLPNILLWNSPCKPHSKPSSKYYIAEVFRKNLSAIELKEIPSLFFSRIIVFNNAQNSYTTIVPRDDAPLFIQNEALCYLRVEEGLFYNLFIDKSGQMTISKNEKTSFPPKDINCTPQQMAQFKTLLEKDFLGPILNAGAYCKEIWDKTSNSYKTIILGRSCD